MADDGVGFDPDRGRGAPVRARAVGATTGWRRGRVRDGRVGAGARHGRAAAVARMTPTGRCTGSRRSRADAERPFLALALLRNLRVARSVIVAGDPARPGAAARRRRPVALPAGVDRPGLVPGPARRRRRRRGAGRAPPHVGERAVAGGRGRVRAVGVGDRAAAAVGARRPARTRRSARSAGSACCCFADSGVVALLGFLRRARRADPGPARARGPARPAHPRRPRRRRRRDRRLPAGRRRRGRSPGPGGRRGHRGRAPAGGDRDRGGGRPAAARRPRGAVRPVARQRPAAAARGGRREPLARRPRACSAAPRSRRPVCGGCSRRRATCTTRSRSSSGRWSTSSSSAGPRCGSPRRGNDPSRRPRPAGAGRRRRPALLAARRFGPPDAERRGDGGARRRRRRRRGHRRGALPRPHRTCRRRSRRSSSGRSSRPGWRSVDPVSIVIVDDHPAIVDGVRAWCAAADPPIVSSERATAGAWRCAGRGDGRRRAVRPAAGDRRAVLPHRRPARGRGPARGRVLPGGGRRHGAALPRAGRVDLPDEGRGTGAPHPRAARRGATTCPTSRRRSAG